MKSLERRFKNIQEKNIYWSTYLCFAEGVKAQQFGRQSIHRWFNKLVSKDDYAQNEKKEVLSFLMNLSSPLKATRNTLETAPPATEKEE